MSFSDLKMKFCVGYASYLRVTSPCQNCKQEFQLNELHISFNSQIFLFHVGCFFEKQSPVPRHWVEIANFEWLKYADQIKLMNLMNLQVDENCEIEQQIRAQISEYHEYLDKAKQFGSVKLDQFLKSNGYLRKFYDLDDKRHLVAEFLLLGALKECEKCTTGFYSYESSAYHCQTLNCGIVRCTNIIKNPPRRECCISEDFKALVDQNKLNATKIISRSVPDKTFNDEDACRQPNKGTFGINFPRDAKVYESPDKVVYSCHLSKVDLNDKSYHNYKMMVVKKTVGIVCLLKVSPAALTGHNFNKSIDFKSVEEACEAFKKEYEEATGFQWDPKKRIFQKLSEKFYHLDFENNFNNQLNQKFDDSYQPWFAKPVHDLVQLLFDIDIMKNSMVEYELDPKLLPIECLNETQLSKAKTILLTLYSHIRRGNNEATKKILLEHSNQFYSMIPHGAKKQAEVIDNQALWIKKMQLLRQLKELEFIYRVSNRGADTIVDNYSQLNSYIFVLDPTEKIFELIVNYCKNTMSKAHERCRFEIEEIFKVHRFDDNINYEKFTKFENKKLLWHGSRVTSFARILRTGLQLNSSTDISITGSMFGRGIYFADMVSKSAQYAMKPDHAKTGLLLLCEVALGNPHCITNPLGANFGKSDLPLGTNSVMALGQSAPGSDVVIDEGVLVPMGYPPEYYPSRMLKFNEYVIYDETQCKLRFLVKVRFLKNK